MFMKFKKKKKIKILSILIIAAIFVLLLAVKAGGINPIKKPSTENQLSQDDNKIADDISNMTGVKREEIVKLKNSGKKWTEILELLRNNSTWDKQVNIDARENLLLESGVDPDFINKLRDTGFSNSKIIEAKSLVERLIFQLNEIFDKKNEVTYEVENNISQNEQDLQAYKELTEKIDIKIAIYLILKLEEDFGSMEKVLDEYLLSLQLGIDLNTYLIDKKTYETEKNEKNSKSEPQKIITLEKIEAKVLDEIQSRNKKFDNLGNVPSEVNLPDNNITNNTLPNDDLNESPLPEVGDPKPLNPQDDVLNEINVLKNKSLSIEGR